MRKKRAKDRNGGVLPDGDYDYPIQSFVNHKGSGGPRKTKPIFGNKKWQELTRQTNEWLEKRRHALNK